MQARGAKIRRAVLLTLLVIVAALVVWRKFVAADSWLPAHTHRTAHYTILSTANRDVTRTAGELLELLYTSHADVLPYAPPTDTSPALAIRLYRSRTEFRSCNWDMTWQEAFYDGTTCYQYFDPDKDNPYHWAIHEATHQLNRQVGHLPLTRWADEGLACYFATSRIENGRIDPGTVDWDTYPAWWMASYRLSGDLQQDIATKQIIPLREILIRSAQPTRINPTYIHWWSLTHFLFHYEDGKYADAFDQLIREGTSIQNFERLIGPVDIIQKEWYRHLEAMITRSQ